MGRAPDNSDLLPLIVKGYLFGTGTAAVVLHLAVSINAPGDGGTMLALLSFPILLILILMLGLIGIVAFPVAALLSWPFRRLAFNRPAVALLLACGVGVGLGAVLTATEFQIGPGDFWSGPLVGLVYGAVWFLVVRTSRRLENYV
jgi:hypothetical protein